MEINSRNRLSWTPLHVAAMKGNSQAVSELMDLGADSTLKNLMGATALHIGEWV